MSTAILYRPSSARLRSGRGAMRRGLSGSPRGWMGKLEADYSDLLGMSDIAESPPPPASPDALLTKLVQEHLNRAASSASAETPSEGELSESASTEGLIAELDSEAMPADTRVAPEPVAELPAAAAGAPKSAAEPFRAATPAPDLVIPCDPFAAQTNSDGGTSVSAAELDALLSTDAQVLVDQETAAGPTAAAELPGEPPSLEPAAALATEARAALTSTVEVSAPPDLAPAPPTPAPEAVVPPQPLPPLNPAAAVIADATPAPVPAPAPTPATAPATVGPPAAVTPAAPEAPTMPGPTRRSSGTRAAGFFHDLLLMVAQVVDLPFTRLSESAKRLLAFAGAVLLVSGLVLLIVGFLQH